MSAVIGFGIT